MREMIRKREIESIALSVFIYEEEEEKKVATKKQKKQNLCCVLCVNRRSDSVSAMFVYNNVKRQTDRLNRK